MGRCSFTRLIVGHAALQGLLDPVLLGNGDLCYLRGLTFLFQGYVESLQTSRMHSSSIILL